MPEAPIDYEGEKFVAPEKKQLSSDQISELFSQEVRPDEEKSLHLAGKIHDAVNEIVNLQTQERILRELGVDDQVRAKANEVESKQAEVETTLHNEGILKDITKMSSGEARHLSEVLRQRLRAIDLERKTLDEAGRLFEGKGVNDKAEFLAEKIYPRIKSCDDETLRLVPIFEASQTRTREASMAEFNEEKQNRDQSGGLINVGQVGRFGY